MLSFVTQLFIAYCLIYRYSKEKGRYVVANRAIKAGETLFVEKPSTLVVLPDFHQSRCHHCTLQFTAKAYYPYYLLSSLLSIEV